MNPYISLMRIDKPIGIYLLLWPAMWALFLAADGLPRMELLFIFVSGVILMRTAGCVINDYADREIDRHVERTKNRPITTGEISASSALVIFFVLIVSAFVLVLFTNWLTIKLSFIAAAIATLYPFTKRWTNLPQIVLGVAFAMSVPMAFAATNNNVPYSAWWLFAATVVWTVVYDTMYAMADREDDLKIDIKSTAILFDKYDRAVISILQIALLLILIKVSIMFNLGYFFYLSLILSAFIMIYHQILIKKREKEKCFKAFLHNHYIGVVIFAGISISVVL
ncbi:MAG: 4-hydroxybenzoate octaprenyltransferase [PS1 clade bacterium]